MSGAHTRARAVRVLGAIALLGVATFASVCTAVQFLRTDYNWLGVPLSFYVIGPYGSMVEVGYFALAPGLAALGIAWYLALDPKVRSIAPVLLFILSAVALGGTATEITDVPGGPHTLHGHIHVLAAVITFLSVTIAMLLQSWCLRGDRRWRKDFPFAFVLAVVAFIALWADALIKAIPRGLGEKVVIALILLWLWRAAWPLMTRSALPDGLVERSP
jgi:hypothetical protein